MGWNSVSIQQPTLTALLDDQSRYYFVHSVTIVTVMKLSLLSNIPLNGMKNILSTL